MPRTARTIKAGMIYHVFNRSNFQQKLFGKPKDYEAFLAVLKAAVDLHPVDLLCYTLMDDHWHLLIRPRTATALGRFMGWVGVTHVRRHHVMHQSRGGGHLYQGRYKSFPVQDDRHFLTVCQFVESNALRVGRVKRAQDWKFSSLNLHEDGPGLGDWPMRKPSDWLSRVNRPIEKEMLAAVHLSVTRGRPFGAPEWVAQAVKKLKLEHTVRSPGRPRKIVVAARGKKTSR